MLSLWRWGRRHAAVLGVMLLLALPLLGAIGSLLGRHWYPSGDGALAMYRIRDVGGIHTPLVGLSSRWGWSHPGPLLFWGLTPFYLAFGQTGVLAGMAIENGLVILAIVAVGYRRGGIQLALFTGLMVALLVRALGLETLIDPWVPWAAVLPFLLFLMLVWSATCDDLAMLPLAVFVGSYAVQIEAIYAPVVGGLTVFVIGRNVAVAVKDRRPGKPRRVRQRARQRQKWTIVAVLVGIVSWLPPIIQQLIGDPGNLGELLSFSRDPGESSLGWSRGFGIMGAQLRPWGPWINGSETDRFGLVATAGLLPTILTLVLAVSVGMWARRRGHVDAARLVTVAVLASGLGLLATTRVTGAPYTYVLRWWWTIAALTALAIAWCVWRALSLPPLRRVVNGACLAALAASVGMTLSDLPAAFPNQDISNAIAHVGGDSAAALDPSHRFIVHSVDSRSIQSTQSGLLLDLERRGLLVYADRSEIPPIVFGSWRLARRNQVDEIVTIVAGPELDAGYHPPDQAILVASWDPLTAGERARARLLEGRIRHSLRDRAPQGRIVFDTPVSRSSAGADGASPAEIEELHVLQQRGDSYLVFVSPSR